MTQKDISKTKESAAEHKQYLKAQKKLDKTAKRNVEIRPKSRSGVIS